MRVNNVVPEFVVSFPKELEPGVLYVSAQFATSAHLCACGCNREVVTPLSPSQWTVVFDGAVSVRPSIGNWTLPCRSHYVIDRGAVRWERCFTRHEARSNRESDHALLDEIQASRQGWWQRLVRRISWRSSRR
jgi:hypothetical protein